MDRMATVILVSYDNDGRSLVNALRRFLMEKLELSPVGGNPERFEVSRHNCFGRWRNDDGELFIDNVWIVRITPATNPDETSALLVAMGLAHAWKSVAKQEAVCYGYTEEERLVNLHESDACTVERGNAWAFSRPMFV